MSVVNSVFTYTKGFDMITRLTCVVEAIQHAIHIIKPLLFEMVLFLWAAYEMGRFIFSVVTGGHQG